MDRNPIENPMVGDVVEKNDEVFTVVHDLGGSLAVRIDSAERAIVCTPRQWRETLRGARVVALATGTKSEHTTTEPAANSLKTHDL